MLQPQAWVEDKESKKIKSGRLYQHIILHGALVAVLIADFQAWMLVLAVMIVHGAIDLAKLYLQSKENRSIMFFTDQALHLFSLVALIYWVFPEYLNVLPDTSLDWVNVYLFTIGLVFITSVSNVIIKIVLSQLSPSIIPNEEESLPAAGKYIGILERLFVFAFVMTGHWEAIGFLLTAKSVFRFGDLKEAKDRKLTEYILIGTLLSFGLAMLAGIIVYEAVY
jgi:hypothetical protein